MIFVGWEVRIGKNCDRGLKNAFSSPRSQFLFRINFKVLLLTFKAIRKSAPSYINDLVKIKPLNSRYGLRSNDGILLSHPNFKTLTTLGDRAFVASAPKLWNDLPSDIRMAESVGTFKKLLKTHLFSKAFYS